MDVNELMPRCARMGVTAAGMLLPIEPAAYPHQESSAAFQPALLPALVPPLSRTRMAQRLRSHPTASVAPTAVQQR